MPVCANCGHQSSDDLIICVECGELHMSAEPAPARPPAAQESRVSFSLKKKKQAPAEPVLPAPLPVDSLPLLEVETEPEETPGFVIHDEPDKNDLSGDFQFPELNIPDFKLPHFTTLPEPDITELAPGHAGLEPGTTGMVPVDAASGSAGTEILEVIESEEPAATTAGIPDEPAQPVFEFPVNEDEPDSAGPDAVPAVYEPKPEPGRAGFQPREKNEEVFNVDEELLATADFEVDNLDQVTLIEEKAEPLAPGPAGLAPDTTEAAPDHAGMEPGTTGKEPGPAGSDFFDIDLLLTENAVPEEPDRAGLQGPLPAESPPPESQPSVDKFEVDDLFDIDSALAPGSDGLEPGPAGSEITAQTDEQASGSAGIPDTDTELISELSSSAPEPDSTGVPPVTPAVAKPEAEDSDGGLIDFDDLPMLSELPVAALTSAEVALPELEPIPDPVMSEVPALAMNEPIPADVPLSEEVPLPVFDLSAANEIDDPYEDDLKFELKLPDFNRADDRDEVISASELKEPDSIVPQADLTEPSVPHLTEEPVGRSQPIGRSLPSLALGGTSGIQPVGGQVVLLDQFQRRLKEAQILERKNRIAQSISIYTELLETNPEHRELLFFLGSAHRRTGDLDKALRYLETIVQLYPDDTHARCNFAGLLVEQNRIPDAIRELETAMKFDPNDVLCLTNLKKLKRFGQKIRHRAKKKKRRHLFA